jgi:hypothetical protein
MLIAAALVLPLACASTRTLSTEAGPDSPLASLGPLQPLPIVGYTTRDGVRTPFSGTIRRAGEVYAFRPESALAAEFTLPVQQLESIDVISTSRTERTALLMLAVVAVLFGLYISRAGFGVD